MVSAKMVCHKEKCIRQMLDLVLKWNWHVYLDSLKTFFIEMAFLNMKSLLNDWCIVFKIIFGQYCILIREKGERLFLKTKSCGSLWPVLVNQITIESFFLVSHFYQHKRKHLFPNSNRKVFNMCVCVRTHACIRTSLPAHSILI